jgi:hypothetical protein
LTVKNKLSEVLHLTISNLWPYSSWRSPVGFGVWSSQIWTNV